MKKAQAVVAGAACLLAILGIAHLFGVFEGGDGSRPPLETSRTEPTMIAEGSVSGSLLREEAPAAARRMGRWLTVVTESDVPIQGAQVFALPDEARRWMCSPPVSVTGSDGVARIPELPPTAKSDRFLVSKDAYQARVVELGKGVDGQTTVHLEHAEQQAVVVRTRDGRLVPDVIVLASTAPLGEARFGVRDTTLWVPVPGPGGAVHESKSDAYGRASFRSLAPGKYHFAIVSERWWLSLPGRIATPEVPSEDVFLELVEPHVAVARFNPAVPSERVNMWGDGLDANAFRGSDYLALLKRLEARYPETKVFVCVRSDGRATPVDLHGEAITEQGARATFDIAARLLSEFEGPTDVTLAASGEVGGAIHVSVGSSLEAFKETLTARAWIGNKEGIRVLKIGSSNPVPAGAYTVEFGPSWVGRLAPTEEVVVAPGSEVKVVFDPKVPFCVVEFRTVVPSGKNVPGIQLLAIDKSGDRDVTQASYVGRWTGSCQMLLPEGKYDIRARTQDYLPESVTINVSPAGGDPMQVKIHLRPKKDG